MTSVNHLLRSAKGSLFKGSALLFLSMTLVNLGNYVANLLLGRWLGPSAFAEASLIITIFLLLTVVTGTLQTLSARFAAQYAAQDDLTGLQGFQRWTAGWSWKIGFGVAVVGCIASPWLQQFFVTTSPWPFVMLALAMPFYFVLGLERGIIQGRTKFGNMAVSYQIEMWARLLATVVFLFAGFSVLGAVGGLLVSIGAAWAFVTWSAHKDTAALTAAFSEEAKRDVLLFVRPVIAALIGECKIDCVTGVSNR